MKNFLFSAVPIICIGVFPYCGAGESILQNGNAVTDIPGTYAGQSDLVVSRAKPLETLYYPTLGRDPKNPQMVSRGLLRWDATPLKELFLSGDNAVLACSLQLAIWYNHLIPNQQFTLHEILPPAGGWTPWGSGFQQITCWDFMNKNIKAAWPGAPGCGKPGVDYAETPLAVISIDNATTANPRFLNKVQLPVALVKRWALHPETNHGLLLKSSCEAPGSKPAQTSFIFSHVTNPRWTENYFPKLSLTTRNSDAVCRNPGNGLLFKDGKCDYVIIIPDQPQGTESLAADELADYLAELTGVRLPVLPESVYRQEFGPFLSVGLTNPAKKFLSPQKLAEFGDEGYLSARDGRNVIIAGGVRRGTLYGVYDYLEKSGIRWFTPTLTCVPKLPEASLPEAGEFIPPVFYRDMQWNNRAAGYPEWLARMRLNGEYARLPESLGGSSRVLLECHSFHRLVTPDEFTRHPDWFALKEDGKRHPGDQHSVELCTTNPELRAYLATRVKEELRKSPNAEYIWVSQDDGRHSGCFCPSCTRERVQFGGTDPSRMLNRQTHDSVDPLNSGDISQFAWSANTISLANFVGDAIRGEFPRVKVKTLAYSYTWTAPKNLKIHDNVMVVLCGPADDWFNSYKATALPASRKWWEELVNWGLLGGNLQLYTYGGSNYGYWWPFPTWFSTCEILQDSYQLGCNALYVQGAASGTGSGFVDLRAYLNARTMYHPDGDFKNDFYEFTNAYYGPAAKPIQDYILWFDDYIRKNKIAAHHNWGDEKGWREWMTPEVIAKSEQLLFPALEAAKGQGEEYEKRALAACMPTICAKILANVLDEPLITRDEIFFIRPEKQAEVQKLAELFNRGMKLNGYDRWNELSTYDSQTGIIARLCRRHPLYTLSNKNITLTVTPSLGGRILSLRCQGFKQNLFRAPGGNLKAGYEEYSNGSQEDDSAKVSYEATAVNNDSIRLHADLGQGLEATRVIRLDKESPRFSISSVYKNVGDRPVKVKLRSHPEFDYAQFKDFRIFINTQQGWMEQPPVGDSSKGTDRWFDSTPSAEDKSKGLWLLGDKARNVAVVHSYSPPEVKQVYYYSGKPHGSVTMELFAPEQVLQPGQEAALNQSFEICDNLAALLKQ